MSITQVAEQAGVSVATVSRMINGKSNVSVAAAERIRATMQQLGYRPRAVRPGPRQASRKRFVTGNVMLLSLNPFEPEAMFQMPTFATMVGRCMACLGMLGAHLLLAHSPDGKAIPPALTGGKVDGVIVAGKAPRLSAALRARLRLLPVVWIYRDHNDPERLFDHVLYDNRAVGGLAAHYLAERGHRRVAFVSTNGRHEAYIERRDVFLQEAGALGLQVEVLETEGLLPPGERVDFAERETARLLARPRAERVTGMFCSADDQLMGMYNAWYRQGGAPAELDMLGCNNDGLYLDPIFPRPASIDIRLDEVGRRAVEMLMQRIANPRDEARTEMLIRPLVVPGGKG